MDGIALTMVFLIFMSLSSLGLKADIPLGSSLSPTTSTHHISWPSPSGLFAYGFYKQQEGGFGVGVWLVGLKSNTVVWSANRDDPPLTSNATLQLTLQGIKLVDQGQAKLITNANANATAFSASMLDSGNFVLYNKESGIIWQSFDYPTDTILGDQILRSGDQLVSGSSETNYSTGRFRLKMQVDGNLVLYPLNTDDVSMDAYWATDTSGYGGFKFHLNLNKTGILMIRNGSDLNLVRRLYPDSFSSTNVETPASVPGRQVV